MAAELIERIKGVLPMLPSTERSLVEKHYFGDQTLDQAAASLPGSPRSMGKPFARPCYRDAHPSPTAGMRTPARASECNRDDASWWR